MTASILALAISMAASSMQHLQSNVSCKNPPTHNSIDSTSFIQRHNYYRSQVGAPEIKWSKELAAYAQSWANNLASKCQMIHSSGNYGENIYWTSGTATEDEVVDYWASEEIYFNHKNPTYIKGRSHKSGHYSQIIWAKTQYVGAAKATCKGGGEIWVSSYNPAGNVIGEKAY